MSQHVTAVVAMKQVWPFGVGRLRALKGVLNRSALRCLESLQANSQSRTCRPIADRRVVELTKACVLGRADHSLRLAIGPGMIRLGEPMSDAFLSIDSAEDWATDTPSAPRCDGRTERHFR
jgi:hypothetical protein